MADPFTLGYPLVRSALLRPPSHCVSLQPTETSARVHARPKNVQPQPGCYKSPVRTGCTSFRTQMFFGQPDPKLSNEQPVGTAQHSSAAPRHAPLQKEPWDAAKVSQTYKKIHPRVATIVSTHQHAPHRWRQASTFPNGVEALIRPSSVLLHGR